MRRHEIGASAGRGMTLVEILVTIFVLAVGLLAVIRVLVPGLTALPRSDNRARAGLLCQDAARRVEIAPERRPDAVAHAVKIDPANLSSGWRLIHDVCVGDVDQMSPSLSAANPGAPAIWPAYPNLVIGERFQKPLPGQPVIVEAGPYVQGSLWVYYPDPYVEVTGVPTDPGTFSVSANTVTFVPRNGTVVGFMAGYTYLAGPAQPADVVGETPQLTGPTTFNLGAVPIRYSVSLYEIAPGVVSPPAPPNPDDLGRGGAIQFNSIDPPPGTVLACMYEIKAHVRTGIDEAMRTRESLSDIEDLRNVAVPDILTFDTYVPVNADATGLRRVKLPFEHIAGITPEGATVPLDDTGPENVRLVSKIDGQVGVPGSGIVDDGAPGDNVAATDGFLTFDGTLGPGTPVRVYYRLNGGWSIERHVAAANYSQLNRAATVFNPGASRGLKQYWYSTWTSPSPRMLTLVFHNLPGNGGPVVGRFETYWRTGAPPMNYEADGHRIAVDYRYAAPDPNDPNRTVTQRVTGETHLVDFYTHAFTLNHPDVVQIDAVRGISYKVRACFDDPTGFRSRVDDDTLAMR